MGANVTVRFSAQNQVSGVVNQVTTQLNSVQRITRRAQQEASRANNQRLREERYIIGLRERAQREEERRTRQFVTFQRNLRRQEQQALREQEQATLSLLFAFQQYAFVVDRAADAILRFSIGNIQAAANLETFAASMRVATSTASEAERSLNGLLELTVDLVGIDTSTLFQYAARLRTAGLAAQESENVIAAVTRRIAEQGKGSFVTARVLEQFTQAINANVITMQDFRPILREFPTLYRDFSNALGVTINNLEDLRAVADASGGATRVIVQALSSIAATAQGANLNTINAQLDKFNDNLLLVRAELGQRLSPAIVSLLKEANNFLQWLRDLPAPIQTAISLTTLLAGAIGKGLAGALSTATLVLQTALIARIGAMSSAMVTGGQATSALRLAFGGFLPVLGKVGIALAAVTTAIAAGVVIYRSLTRETRLAAQAEERLVESTLATGRAISEGNEAIRSRINELQDLIKAEQALLNIEARRRAVSGAGILGPGEIPEGEAETAIRRNLSILRAEQNALRVLLNQVNDPVALGNVQEGLFEALTAARNLGDNQSASRLVGLITQVQNLASAAISSGDALSNARQFLLDYGDAIENNRSLLERQVRAQLQSAQTIQNASAARQRLIRIAQNRAGQERILASTIDDVTEREIELNRINLVLETTLNAIDTAFNNVTEGIKDASAELRRIKAAGAIRPGDIIDPLLPAALSALVPQLTAIIEATQQELLRPRPTPLSPGSGASRAAITRGTGPQQPPALAGSSIIVNRFADDYAQAIIQRLNRAAGSDLAALENEERAFADLIPGGISPLEQLRIDSREQGANFIRQLFQRQLKNEEEDLTSSINRQFRTYQQFYTRLGNLATGALFGRFQSVREVVLQLAQELVRFVITSIIRTQVAQGKAAALDTALTEVRIANQQRLQAVLERTNALYAQQGSPTGATQGAEQSLGVGLLGNILGPALSLLGVPGAGVITNLIQIGPGVAREIGDYQNSLSDNLRN